MQFRVNGTLFCDLTNVLDSRMLSIRQIAECYTRRWDIELAVKLVKRELGLHLRWSAKEPVILHALRLEIAGRAGVDPFDVSLSLVVRYLPRWAAQGYDPVARAVELGAGMHLIRPSRRTVIEAPTPELSDYPFPHLIWCANASHVMPNARVARERWPTDAVSWNKWRNRALVVRH